MMHFIGFLVTGLIVGLLARAIKPGRQNISLGMTTVLGMVGALVAGFIGRALNLYGPEEPAGFIASTIGAIVVLGFYMSSRRGRLTHHGHSTDRAA